MTDDSAMEFNQKKDLEFLNDSLSKDYLPQLIDEMIPPSQDSKNSTIIILIYEKCYMTRYTNQ